MDKNKKVMGKISQIIGAVVDVTFDNQEDLPSIYDALIITRDNGTELVLECEQDIGENTMRCIAMDSTDGLRRGMDVIATGRTISMPATNLNGRLLNVIGETIDGMEQIQTDKYKSIHQDPLLLKIYLQATKYYIRVSK